MGFPKGRCIFPLVVHCRSFASTDETKCPSHNSHLAIPSNPHTLSNVSSALSGATGATGFDVGCETLGACRVVGNSLNCLQTYSCKRRQLRSGGLIPPNLRPICACAF